MSSTVTLQQSTAAVTIGAFSEASLSSNSDGASTITSATLVSARASDTKGSKLQPSLWLMFYLTLLAVTNIVIVIPTARRYAETLGADETFSGLAISLTPFWTVAGIFLNKWMLNFASMKAVLFVMVFGGVVGNSLYALGGLTRSKWSILIARSLIGLCAGQVLPVLYIGQAVDIKKRSEVMFYYQAAAVSGYILGPLIAWALEYFMKSIHYENLVLDSDTIPGWFMASLYFFLLLKVFLIFQSPPAELAAVPVRGRGHLPMRGLLTCLWAICALTVSNSMLEVYLSKVAEQEWRWNVRVTSLYLAAVSAVLAPVCIFGGRLTSAVEDRRGILILCSLGVVFSCLLLNFGLSDLSEVIVLTLGAFLVLSAVTLTKPFVMSVVTKIVPPQLKGLTGTLTIAFLCLGRGIGALLGSLLEPMSVMMVHVAIFGSTALLALASYGHLQQHEHAA
eukprot:TRINITY_DN42564_c0_g1_i1.p1 TRINITY_DN42564_c0_g1~~TRINITY_DN42564_c0_g1_i1.p1  ORF type:complete len:450 (+),score=64.82 TRINITY_DN42564_c0_g1_i1:84-1433(+)